MWARVHKIDRIRPRPDGSAQVLVEDDRNPAQMARVPGLSIVIAIARVLNARRVLATKYGGKGEIRYAAPATPPPAMSDAIARAGASVTGASGEPVVVPAAAAAIASAIVDAFAELAHHVRTNVGAKSVKDALDVVAARRRAPLDRDRDPAAYWPAVFALLAHAGELLRARGGRWIETSELPVPFAIRLARGELALPAKAAMGVVEGGAEAALPSP
jgi:hypothetical protein